MVIATTVSGQMQLHDVMQLEKTKIKEGVTARKVKKDNPHSTVTSSENNVSRQKAKDKRAKVKKIKKFSLRDSNENKLSEGQREYFQL